MLKTRLTGQTIGDSDDLILKWIEQNKFKAQGHNMIIGVENKECEVYRIIEISGFNDFVEIMEFFVDLGMEDITEIPYAPKKGYDGRFRYPELIHLSKDGRRMVTRKQ